MNAGTLKTIAKRILPTGALTRIRNVSHPDKKLDLEWTLKSGFKIKIQNQSEWVLYNDIFVDGEYDLPLEELLNQLASNEPMIVLDIGSNVGFFSLRLFDLCEQMQLEPSAMHVIAIEGSPRLAKELSRRLLEENALSDNVSIIHGLVGARAGEGRISEGSFHATNSIFKSGANSVEVKFFDLETALSKQCSISLLKCDIEGAEELFLQNYREFMTRVHAAVFEFHPRLCDTGKCKSILEEAGFNKSRTLRTGEDFEVLYFWR